MNEFSDNSPDGLAEGVGQELKPCGPTASDSSPLQPQNGQWSFRFNHWEPHRISVNVEVLFGPPFSFTSQLCSEMNRTQVESLRDWLARVIDVMDSKPAAH